jgi:hypothetical protein
MNWSAKAFVANNTVPLAARFHSDGFLARRSTLPPRLFAACRAVGLAEADPFAVEVRPGLKAPESTGNCTDLI